MLLDELQAADLTVLVDYVRDFWLRYASTRTSDPVAPVGLRRPLAEILEEPLPKSGQSLQTILESIDAAVVPYAVKTAHPLFLAYVTPPSLDICVLGDAVAALLNQNVCFADLSPVGTAIEERVVQWLAEIVGYGRTSGGVLVSGGSAANLYGLAAGRRAALGSATVSAGNFADWRPQRIYCSEHVHRSVHKAAMLVGVGTNNIVAVPADENHEVRLSEMAKLIERDRASGLFVPTTIVGAAGTRESCAFDDIQGLHEIAKQYDLWLHVDAAYGGFLKLADPSPKHLQSLHLADSITIDPHKLLFVPFDSGCFLIRDRQNLLETFGTEGEYLEKSHTPGADFADFGMELGRAMRALKVWLALKYVGVNRFANEITRLIGLAQYLAERVRQDEDLELLAPVAGTVVCFRWKRSSHQQEWDLDAINKRIRATLLRDGIAYINEVSLNRQTGLRVCMTNFRTETRHLDGLLTAVHKCAEA